MATIAFEDHALSLKTTNLEQAYQNALREAERIYEEERFRVLRVQLLLTQDENDLLQDHLAARDAQASDLEYSNDVLRHDIEQTETDLQKTIAELKLRSREVERCKAEIQALSASSSDATKILTEKLALARELATLKPEIEHLRSQSTSQQGALAENLTLQRELSSLQVELETEKRAVQRLKTHEKTARAEPEHTSGTEDLKRELAKEKREAQKADRDMKKRSIEWENQKDILEGKLEAFRTKLRLTKDQLKEARDELDKNQAAQFAKSSQLTAVRATGANAKKRTVTHFDPDMTIGTPGHGVGRPAKKAKASSHVNDDITTKPSFSITPFLNRTLSVLQESPSQVEANLSQYIDKLATEAEENQSPAAAASKQPTAGKPKPRPLQETTGNTLITKSRLPKVAEEDEEIDVQKDDPPNFETDQPVKRQKVLGQKKRMFEGDSDIEPKVQRKLGTGLRGGGAGDLSFLLAPGTKKSKNLASFSPLKKDRKSSTTFLA